MVLKPSFNASALAFLAMLFQIAQVSAKSKADFLIVGGGTAGCVVAARLCTALPNSTIILLERGIPRNETEELLVRAIRLAEAQVGVSSIVEKYGSEPNPGMNGRKVLVANGITLGGSSAISGAQWTIPIQGSVESWAVKGLTTDTASRYYKRAARVLGVSAPPKNIRQIYSEDMLDAGKRAGFPELQNPLDGKQINGLWNNILAVKPNGARTDSYSAYVKPVANNRCRRNLRIMQGVTVTKLLTRKVKSGKYKVIGVATASTTNRNPGKTKTILARKEVVLSAGPYESPKLLQLSGIGPRSVLEPHGIDVKLDVPVGNESQARPLGFVAGVYSGKPLALSNNSTLLYSESSKRQFLKGKGGPYAIAGSALNGRFGKIGYTSITSNSIIDIDTPFVSVLCLTNPKSKSSVLIRNKNAFSIPKVNSNMFSRKEDVISMQKCLRSSRKVIESFAKEFKMEEYPAKNITIDENLIRTKLTGSSLHFVGGCKFGRVVDNDFKVKGLTKLRVVDASVIPEMTQSAGPLSAVYMLAELASEKIVKQYA